MGRVDGKVALVTGAAQGLGEASARMLVREGAKVAVTDINFEGATAVVDSLGEDAIALHHDVTDEAQWQSVLSKTVKHFGGLHVLVNNAGIIAGYNTASYNSAKAGVRHLTKSVALHCARQGYNIRCNSVHPVFMATALLDELVKKMGKAEAFEKLGRQIPLGHIGEPDDVAYAVLYLASDESRMMTGSELVIDGGISAM